MLPKEHKITIQNVAKQFDAEYKLWLKQNEIAKKSKSIFLTSVLFGGVYAGGVFGSIEVLETAVKFISSIAFFCGLVCWYHYRRKAIKSAEKYVEISQKMERQLALYMSDAGRVYTLDAHGNTIDSFDVYNEDSYT